MRLNYTHAKAHPHVLTVKDTPPHGWVYLLCQNGVVMYVGASRLNVWERIFQHEHGRGGQVEVRFDEALILPVRLQDRTRLARALVRAMQPHANTKHKGEEPTTEDVRLLRAYGFLPLQKEASERMRRLHREGKLRRPA